MDRFETTREVTENENVLRENLNSCERHIRKFTAYINQLNVMLGDLQAANTPNLEILETNNLSETVSNKTLKTFENTESSQISELDELYKESSEIEDKVTKIDQEVYEELRKKVKAECEEERRISELYIMKFGLLKDKINMVLPEETTRAGEKKDKTQEKTLKTEQLDKECLEVETNLRQAEIESEKQTEALNSEFDLKEKENKVLSCEAILKNMDDKIAAIRNGLDSLFLTFECNKQIDLATKKIGKSIEQNRNSLNKLNAKTIDSKEEYEAIDQELKNMTVQIDIIKEQKLIIKSLKENFF